MDALLRSLTADQQRDENVGDVTIELSTGTKVTGILEGVADDGVLTMRRLVNPDSYADVPRHYRVDSVVAAYLNGGS